MVSWLAASALARSPDPSACRTVGAVRFAAEQVEVPLLRGPNTGFLPAVEGVVSTPGGDRPGLFVLDLAGGCSRIDPATARAFGLSLDGDAGAVEVAALNVGSLRVERVTLLVDPDAPGVVLGVPSLGVGAAVIPSAGVARLVPRAAAARLVGAIGVPVTVPGRRGDALRVPGAVRWGPVVVEGTFELRTDLGASRLVPATRLPDPIQRGGVPSYDVGIRLGESWLADTWIHRTGDADLDPIFVGAMGYDVLFAVDLAVDPGARTVAFRLADADRSVDATAVALASARARYAAEEKAAAGTALATQEAGEARATIGFDGPVRARVPLGDPGTPVVRDRNLVLADTAWRAGELEEALTHYFAAARYAGDHCGAHLDLARRRTAWAGSRRGQSALVQQLIDDPLNRAYTLWTTWSKVDPAVRDAVRAGAPPAGGVQVDQPESCAVVVGLRHRLASLATSAVAAELEKAHPRDPGVGWSRLLTELDAGRYGPAASLFPLSEGGAPDLWRELVALRIAAALGQLDRVDDAWRDIPGADTDAPLLSALLVLDAGSGLAQPADLTRKLLRQDPRWVPAQLVHALASGDAPPPLDPAALARMPGSPSLVCQQAVHQALSGDLAGAQRALDAQPRVAEPDWWAATAVVAHLRHDPAARDQAVAELRWRFPLIPVDRLGLREPPPPPAVRPR